MSNVSPQVLAASQSTRTEAAMRELIRAKLVARDAYDAIGYRNVANLSIDERIDLELERSKLYRAWEDARRAVINYERGEREGVQ